MIACTSLLNQLTVYTSTGIIGSLSYSRGRSSPMSRIKNGTMSRLNRHLKPLKPYPPGKPVEEIQRVYGLDDVIKLASNENPIGPSPKVVGVMASLAPGMNVYPDGSGYFLKKDIATHLGIREEELILGNGSDDITTFLAQCYLNRRRGMITSNYAFVRYRMAAMAMDAPLTLVPMKNMRHDLESISRAVDRSTAMVCLDIPCNPTGTIVNRRQIVRFMNRMPDDVLVVLDQAYFEYAIADPDYPDGLELRKRYPNLIVTRTFSKAYGLAGLRIGYAVADPDLIADLDRVRPPFNTNRMAQAAARAALSDRAHLRKCIKVNRAGMQQLEKGFVSLDLKYWPSHANFILVDVGRDCLEVYESLLRAGVITRPMDGLGLVNCLRISIGKSGENRRCLAALRKSLITL
jgi:histidinol-phosphate aminotransferase